MTALLQIKNLTVTFLTAPGMVRAADDVTFDLEEGETLALVGETGSGKSVVAHAILNLLPENALATGTVWYRNRNLLEMKEKDLSKIRGREISLIIQNPALALNPVYSVGHQMVESLRLHRGMKKSEAARRARDLLQKLRFKGPEIAMRMYPFQMSGGMKQRVLIGISVVLNPRLIIADEPTTGLESRLRDVVLEELMIAKEMDRSSMLLITHDLHAARKTAGRVAIMYAGEIIEIGPSQEILGDPFHPYSRALMGSLPEQGLRPIPGMPPSALSPPEGCRFHPRCPLRKPPCFHEKQKLIRAGTRKVRCVLYA